MIWQYDVSNCAKNVNADLFTVEITDIQRW